MRNSAAFYQSKYCLLGEKDIQKEERIQILLGNYNL